MNVTTRKRSSTQSLKYTDIAQKPQNRNGDLKRANEESTFRHSTITRLDKAAKILQNIPLAEGKCVDLFENSEIVFQ